MMRFLLVAVRRRCFVVGDEAVQDAQRRVQNTWPLRVEGTRNSQRPERAGAAARGATPPASNGRATARATSSRRSRRPSTTGTSTTSACRWPRTAGSARHPSRRTTARPTGPWSSRSSTSALAEVATSILDLHWSDAGEWGKQIGQHVMPDQNSLAFWKDVAPAYKNHPAVLFDLYNEPHDVSWDIWLKGGQGEGEGPTAGTPARPIEAVGMQALLDAVRATGAKNVVIAGGLDWAYDFSGILDGQAAQRPRGKRRDLCQSCVSVQGRHRGAMDRQDGGGDARSFR